MAENAPQVFEAMIVPHRSLSRRGRRWVVGVVCAFSLMVTLVCWWIGAWPVIAFNGAEIGFAVLALNWHAERAARATELLLLSESGLRVVRTNLRGEREEKLLPAAWLHVHLEERRGRVPALLLLGHGAREEVAHALGEEEKRSLAGALADALHRLQHPVFDNPQLRD